MSQFDDLDSAAVDSIVRSAIQDVDPDGIKSPALKRLIDDIRDESNGSVSPSQAYNRVHNRHNRGR